MKRFCVLLCGILLCAALSAVMWHAYEAAQEWETLTKSPSTQATPHTTAPPVMQSTTEPSVTEVPISPEEDQPTLVMQWVELPPFASQSGSLILVDSGYVGTQTVWCTLPATQKVAVAGEYRLQEQAYLAFYAMMQAYRGDALRVRYAAAQEDADVPPVCRGGAYASGLDVCLEGVDKQGQSVPFFSVSLGREWLYQHCTEYGFVACGEGVFGEEAGHFRYVGTPHAQSMDERGESLAAYLATLRCEHTDYESALVLESVRGGCRVFYVWQDALGRSGALLPQNARYEVSGDNRGGVVVTVWDENA